MIGAALHMPQQLEGHHGNWHGRLAASGVLWANHAPLRVTEELIGGLNLLPSNDAQVQFRTKTDEIEQANLKVSNRKARIAVFADPCQCFVSERIEQGSVIFGGVTGEPIQ